MSKIDAGTLSELLEAFPKAEVRANGNSNICVELYVDEAGDIIYNLKAKTAEPETQGGQNELHR